MPRRIHVSALHAGEILLDESQAHHLRDVLRLKIGSSVELFDDAGSVADAVVTNLDPSHVVVRVDSISHRSPLGELTIASAVPKGDRADWMIEKLSELGVTRFIPLKTARSVVHPTGQSKRDRWMRIATESAKQSRRAGVMQIDELANLSNFLSIQNPQSKIQNEAARYLSTRDEATPISEMKVESPNRLTLFIGPEGGWSDDEISAFDSAGLTGVKLTATILRVETAAIAAAAIAATFCFRQ